MRDGRAPPQRWTFLGLQSGRDYIMEDETSSCGSDSPDPYGVRADFFLPLLFCAVEVCVRKGFVAGRLEYSSLNTNRVQNNTRL